MELTEKQAEDLKTYLLITEHYRKEEYKACKDLAEEKNEDGTAKYPLMAKNAEFWKEQNEAMEEILKTLS